MKPLRVPEVDVLAWITRLAVSTQVLFPQRAKDGGLRFEAVKGGATLTFAGYEPTLLPPGKAFAPAEDVLFEFRHQADGTFGTTPVHDDAPRTLAGVRPCDLRSISLMDAVNRDGVPDPHYLARRDAAAVIAYACAEPCSPRTFCASVGALDVTEGADILLTPIPAEGDPAAKDVMVEARTPLGETLLADDPALSGDPIDDPEAVRQTYRDARPAPFGRQLPGSTADLRAALDDAWDAPLWQAHAEACLCCGTCNLVCPTCFCFDTFDDVDVSAMAQGRPSGRRCRTWDGCMLRDFAVVAGGHDFRPQVAARQRHRTKRKFEYLPDTHGGSFCVGCGRCGSQCTVDIDIFDIARDVLEEHGRGATSPGGGEP